MRRLTIAGLLLLQIVCHAEIEVLSNTTSQNRRFAIGYDSSQVNSERIWRISLPRKIPIGAGYPASDFLGLPHHGRAVWNPRASLVALTQGGIPFAQTKVFHYSSNGLEELPLPDLENLPTKWYPRGTVDRCHVEADRWVAKDRLQIAVSGTLKFEKEHASFAYYDIKVIIRFDSKGAARTVSITDSPLEPL